MGESGILNSFLGILATEGVTKPLLVHVLRLVGNSCADTGRHSLSICKRVLTFCQMKIERELCPKVQCRPLLPF